MTTDHRAYFAHKIHLSNLTADVADAAAQVAVMTDLYGPNDTAAADYYAARQARAQGHLDAYLATRN